MSTDTKLEERTQHIIARLVANDQRYIEDVEDLIRWGYYGPNVFSQFGLGLSGWVFRQSTRGVTTTVKVSEAGVPLVAFVSSGTTTGSVAQMFDMLYNDRVRWQRDKYPWI